MEAPCGSPLRAPLPDALRQSLWQADQLATPTVPGIPSGHPALDVELPGGGWPPGALTELLLESPGRGELRLLAPLLARLTAAGRSVVWVNPPCRPHGPALAAWGIDLSRLLLCEGTDLDGLWAAEQALAAHSGAVLCWTTENPQHRTLLDAALRRLHLQAQGRESLLFLLRPAAAARQSSPAPLRLRCQPWPDTPAHLAVQVVKRRGPAQARPLRLDTRAWMSEALLQRLDKVRSMPFTLPPLPVVARDASPLVVPAPA